MKKHLRMRTTMKKTTNNRTVNSTLINTWETYENIEKQYNDVDSNLSDDTELIVKYINSLDDFKRKVFYLYTEYNSYRKVADETNRSKDVIMQIIRELRQDIKQKKYII